VDLCRRAQANGWSVWYEPALQATHHDPLHQRTVSAALRVLTRHALLTYAHKHWPWWQFRFLSGLVECESLVRQHWAQRCGDLAGAGLFAQLQSIAADLGRGRLQAAQQRLNQVVRRQEQRCAG
jgi:GT2 family glycosyltransferase